MKRSHRVLHRRLKMAIATIGAMTALLPASHFGQTPVPGGANVEVSPTGGTTGATPITLTFANVSEAGTASLNISDTGPALPPGYHSDLQIDYLEVTVDASFAPIVNVRVNYDPTA